jgi:hypothetical protein
MKMTGKEGGWKVIVSKTTSIEQCHLRFSKR